MVFILGLTGSIGMGKSTAAEYLRARHIPVLDSDAVVHQLYAGPLVPAIEALFPGSTAAGVVDRVRLSAALASSPDSFARLEAVVHPAVRDAQRAFVDATERKGDRLVVLEVPLLLETGGDACVDAVLLVTAPSDTQRTRVLARPGMTADKLAMVLGRQMPDAEKRKRADYIVDTSGSISDTWRRIDEILTEVAALPATAYARCWSRRAD